jgi:hypothetical protein
MRFAIPGFLIIFLVWSEWPSATLVAILLYTLLVTDIPSVALRHPSVETLNRILELLAFLSLVTASFAFTPLPLLRLLYQLLLIFLSLAS